MNEAPLGATAPAGELDAYQRISQLQSLIESARSVAMGENDGEADAAPSGSEATGGGDFASALQTATSAAYAPQVAISTAYEPQPAASDAPELAASGAYTPQATGEAGNAGQYEPLIDAAAQQYGIQPALLHGLIQQESGFDAGAQSSAGVSGLTQLMPSTAASMGVADPFNAAESVEGGARYLSEIMRVFGGNATDALAAYHAGPGAVQQYGGVPPYAETQQYVSNVLADADAYSRGHPEAAAGVPV